jgi:hypothetical protein
VHAQARKPLLQLHKIHFAALWGHVSVLWRYSQHHCD